MSENQMRTFILDGGLGSELEKRLPDLEQNPLWSASALITSPDAVKQIHLDYLNAGSEIIMTNTYQISVDSFKKICGIDSDGTMALIDAAVRLAKDARDEFLRRQKPDENGFRSNPLIAGSLGPYGACLADRSEYTGSYIDTKSRRELIEWHRPRVEQLLKSGVDLIAFETIPALEEALAIVELMNEIDYNLSGSDQLKYWISFSAKAGDTAHGERLELATVKILEAVNTAIKNRPTTKFLALGVNCVNPKEVALQLTEIKRGIDKSSLAGKVGLICKPNIGDWENGIEIPSHPTQCNWDLLVPEWLGLGARYIGGCCKITPADITKIRKIVKSTQDTE